MRVHVLGAAALAAALSGCAASHVAYVNDMTMGVDVSYSGEGTAKVVLGFERDTFALVPMKQPERNNTGTGSDDLMALLAASRMAAKGLEEIEFDHIIATGCSAIEIGVDMDKMRQVRDGIAGLPVAGPEANAVATPPSQEVTDANAARVRLCKSLTGATKQ